MRLGSRGEHLQRAAGRALPVAAGTEKDVAGHGELGQRVAVLGKEDDEAAARLRAAGRQQEVQEVRGKAVCEGLTVR